MIPTKCEVCGADLLWNNGGTACAVALDHVRIVPCTRKEFDAAVKAAELAALPQADRLPTIGGWRMSGQPGIWKYSLARPDAQEAIQARAEESGLVRWFYLDDHREREIESAGFVKVKT